MQGALDGDGVGLALTVGEEAAFCLPEAAFCLPMVWGRMIFGAPAPGCATPQQEAN